MTGRVHHSRVMQFSGQQPVGGSEGVRTVGHVAAEDGGEGHERRKGSCSC